MALHPECGPSFLLWTFCVAWGARVIVLAPVPLENLARIAEEAGHPICSKHILGQRKNTVKYISVNVFQCLSVSAGVC
jgi:hypothetical protein